MRGILHDGGMRLVSGKGTEAVREMRRDVSPLRYPGGKRRLAPFVAGLVERAGTAGGLFVEPFAGGAAVALSLLEAGVVGEIALGDRDPHVSAFWTVVFSPQAPLLAEMAATAELTLAEWKHQKRSRPDGLLGQAFRCLYLNRTSFSGSIMDYAGPIGGMSQSGPYVVGSRFNREAVARRILELNALSDRVRFVERGCWRSTAERLSREAGNARLFWYLDPPYFAKARRLYQHSFGREDHEALAAAVESLPGSFLLSYDDHPEAVRLYGAHPGFARVEMLYSARVEAGERKKTEIAVSDVIARLRAAGDKSYDGIVPLLSMTGRRGQPLGIGSRKSRSSSARIPEGSPFTASVYPSNSSSIAGFASNTREARARARTSAA